MTRATGARCRLGLRSAREGARWFYTQTQSRIHVLVTHGFLRSLARLELEESAVGRFAAYGLAPVEHEFLSFE